MGIREALNEKRGLTLAVAGTGTALAIILVAWQLRGGSGGSTRPISESFYTDDDGRTWFAADAAKVPPWDHDGKQAVRCYVFTCDGGRTKFAGYLERCTPEVKRSLEGEQTAGQPNLAANPMSIGAGTEVKPPLAGTWVRRNDPRAAAIMMPKCPAGSSGEPELLLP